MYADPGGNFAFFLLTMLIGATIGFGITTLVDYVDDGEVFNGSVHWGWYVGATLLGAAIGAGIGMGVSYYATGRISSSVGQVWNGLFGHSTFYRTISADDYANLSATGKLRPGTETFITDDMFYAKNYNGITVKFKVKNRTVNWLEKIGVRDNSS